MSEFEPIKEPVTFLFDIIVTRIQFFKDKIDDPNSLIINAKFNRVPINITQSRINVTEFQSGRRIESICQPSMLRQNLETNGMPIVIRYNGATLGTSEVVFPQHFIDRIEAGMVDLMHADTCTIKRRGEEVGVIEILCVLVIKCDEPVGGVSENLKKCENLGKIINPSDVMFLFGEPNICRTPSLPCLDELEPDEGDERLQLDLARFKSLPRPILEPPEEICGVDACCELKSMTEKYGQIIDTIVRQINKFPSPMPDYDCVFTDWGGNAPTFRPQNVERTIPIPIGDLEVEGVKPIRFCPVCLTPLSHLPKYSACPTCCIKPMPEFEPKQVETPTADQIIQQYLKLPTYENDDFCKHPCKIVGEGEEQDSIADDGKGPPKRMNQKKAKNSERNRTTCRCTCKGGKLCVHCRIRKLCADIFKRKGVDGTQEDCPKLKTSNSSEDFAVIVQPDDTECRPYLERVFAELRDLYDKRDATQHEFDKKCTESLLRFGSHRKGEPGVPKKISSSGLLKPVGSPSFLQRARLPKIGHKDCLKSDGIVSKRHGWSWPSSKEARKYGWKPGAICRYAGEIMKFFLQYTPEKSPYSLCQATQDQEKENERRLPILNIRKRNGAIFITLRGTSTQNCEIKPIIFKIVKSDLAVAIKKIKRKLKQMGFRKCTCHQTLMMCVCRKNIEKKVLEGALEKECHRLGIENCVDKMRFTDSSESEMEYNLDISPPVAPRNSLIAIQPRTFDSSTQTKGLKSETEVPTQYPLKLSPYWRSYDCAAGDRYTGTAFGSVGEEVFEDGVFGFRGGGPHGEPATPGGKPKKCGVWGAKPGGPMRGGGRDTTGSVFAGYGGKSFPGAKKAPAGKQKPIPVRMTDRHYKAVALEEKARKDAIHKEIENKKKGTNLIRYLESKGAIPKPWNPNESHSELKTKTKHGLILDEDGLTAAQRNRRALLEMAIPPLDTLARLGRGFDPCSNPCYESYPYQCYYPCYNYC